MQPVPKLLLLYILPQKSRGAQAPGPLAHPFPTPGVYAKAVGGRLQVQIKTWQIAPTTLIPRPLSLPREVFPLVVLSSATLHLWSPSPSTVVTLPAPLSPQALVTILPGIRLHPLTRLDILANRLLLSKGRWNSYLITPLLIGNPCALTTFRKKRPSPLNRLQKNAQPREKRKPATFACPTIRVSTIPALAKS